jgi:hypothetical protein
MNLERLYEILRYTTGTYRKGPIVHGTPDLVAAIERGEADPERLPGGVVSIDAMPHEADMDPSLTRVDCHFVVVGVDARKAEAHRAEFLRLLEDYPQPERLAGGPSYIEVGAEIEDQGAAFCLFALGEALGLWSVITPSKMGITGPQADDLAGRGFIMMSGHRPTPVPGQAAA